MDASGPQGDALPLEDAADRQAVDADGHVVQAQVIAPNGTLLRFNDFSEGNLCSEHTLPVRTGRWRVCELTVGCSASKTL